MTDQLTHECDFRRTTLVTATYDKKGPFPFRQTKVAHCFECGAIYDGDEWYVRRSLVAKRQELGPTNSGIKREPTS
jgi:hypothetical protein